MNINFDIKAYAALQGCSVLDVIIARDLKIGFVVGQLSFSDIANCYKDAKITKCKFEAVSLYSHKLMAVSSIGQVKEALLFAPISAIRGECYRLWSYLVSKPSDCLDFCTHEPKPPLVYNAVVIMKWSNLILEVEHYIQFLKHVGENAPVWLDVFKRALRLSLSKENKDELFELACNKPEAMRLVLKHRY